MLLSVLAVVLAFGPGHALDTPRMRAVIPIIDIAKPDDIRTKLMETLHAMNATSTGIFHDDISAIVAPMFPPGQSFAETQRVLRQNNLGELTMFRGTQDMQNGKMYATRAGLMGGMVSDVDIIIDFDFVGTNEKNMVLQSTKAFLHGTGM